jgi:hypothetical protein
MTASAQWARIGRFFLGLLPRHGASRSRTVVLAISKRFNGQL